MHPLKLYWSRSKNNFGDSLSPAICSLLSGRTIHYAQPHQCDLVAIGSILQRVRHGWFGAQVHIWGTGFIEHDTPGKGKHHYHAVRGHKTAAQLKSASITAFGDPGLLCDMLLPDARPKAKKYALGIVPHYSDQNNSALDSFMQQARHARVFNVFSDVRELLAELASCEFILSSSLHGLIAADALGIPNAWLELSGGLRGNGFKFADYYSVFGIENPQAVTLDSCADATLIETLSRHYQRPGLARIKQQLVASFPFAPSRPIAL